MCDSGVIESESHFHELVNLHFAYELNMLFFCVLNGKV
jgi:hypothetical protein